MAASGQGSGSRVPGLRILVVEDMLAELGHTVVGTAASIEEASRLAQVGDFDGALLDVNLNGETVDAVAQALVKRNIPFVFTTGYGQQGIPEAYRDRPTLQKPYQIEQLGHALARAMETARSAG